jgi:DNA-binding response OmpR family regulator
MRSTPAWTETLTVGRGRQRCQERVSRFCGDLLSNFESIDLSVAPTAEAGMDLAERLQPVVIILDVNLPGMSGLDALQALRARADLKHIPVIALTAAASERDRQHGLQAGFYRYLTKPVQVDELIRVLETLIH